MVDLNFARAVTPSFEPEPGDVLVGSCSDGTIKVYATRNGVTILAADPTDPGNPRKRRRWRFKRGQAGELSDLLRDASFMVVR